MLWDNGSCFFGDCCRVCRCTCWSGWQTSGIIYQDSTCWSCWPRLCATTSTTPATTTSTRSIHCLCDSVFYTFITRSRCLFIAYLFACTFSEFHTDQCADWLSLSLQWHFPTGEPPLCRGLQHPVQGTKYDAPQKMKFWIKFVLNISVVLDQQKVGPISIKNWIKVLYYTTLILVT